MNYTRAPDCLSPNDAGCGMSTVFSGVSLVRYNNIEQRGRYQWKFAGAIRDKTLHLWICKRCHALNMKPPTIHEEPYDFPVRT